MADERRHLQISPKTAALASVAGLAIGGPLVVLMGITFIATITLLLVTSPLLMIFSPVLLGAAFVFAAAMVGFAAAGAMAVAGLWSVAWVFGQRRTAAAEVAMHDQGKRFVPYETY